MSTDPQQVIDEQDQQADDVGSIEAEHRRAQESGEVFDGEPRGEY
ncbi:hypothetical protein [Haloarcula sp. JP-L23]